MIKWLERPHSKLWFDHIYKSLILMYADIMFDVSKKKKNRNLMFDVKILCLAHLDGWKSEWPKSKPNFWGLKKRALIGNVKAQKAMVRMIWLKWNLANPCSTYCFPFIPPKSCTLECSNAEEKDGDCLRSIRTLSYYIGLCTYTSVTLIISGPKFKLGAATPHPRFQQCLRHLPSNFQNFICI